MCYPTKTLDELRTLVRAHERGRHIVAWSAEECRAFLLKRQHAKHSRSLSVQSGVLTRVSASVLSKDELVDRSAMNQRMY